MRQHSSSLALLFALIAPALLWAQYPRIHSLSPQDVVFRQLMEDLDAAYRDEAREKKMGTSPSPAPTALSIYAYSLAKGMDIFSLASRLNLPYDSLASLNRLDSPGSLRPGMELLIPSRPGIFLPENPRSDIEYLMNSWRRENEGGILLSVRRDKGGERFLYFPGERFSGSERVYFLSGAYRYPLPAPRLVSAFGMRTSPITGKYSMHSGIDLQASAGTDVYAARAGRVSFLGWDDVLGNYVSLDHGEGRESVYGHLQKIFVSLNQELKSGSILGAVGSTGKSTGPHLHFEIRVRGEARNPESYLPRMRQ